jgi:hypothetical protein
MIWKLQNKDEPDKMKYYAIVIQKLERELGIKVSSFPEINLLALKFFKEHPEQLSEEEMTADEILNMLPERDKDLLTKLYEGTYEEE